MEIFQFFIVCSKYCPMIGVGLLNMEKPISWTQSMRLLANSGLMCLSMRSLVRHSFFGSRDLFQPNAAAIEKAGR